MDVLDRHGGVLRRELPESDLAGLVVHRGQFHEVVVGADRVICFARTSGAAARFAERVSVLRSLAALELDFATPAPLSDPDPGQAYLVLSRVPGSPLEAHRLADRAVFDAVAAGFAVLLTGLAEAAGRPAAAGMPRSTPQRWTQFAEDVRAELFPLMSADGRARADAELAAAQSLPHVDSAVVHGDLGGENVLWEGNGERPRLSGVVDWDEVGLGDQAEDLAAILASYGEDLLRAVVALLPQRRDVVQRVAAIRGTFALQQALAAVRDGDAAELDDGLTGYR